jgi:hypothetical protein
MPRMTLVPEDYEARAKNAISHYWSTLQKQSTRQLGGDADRGNRTAVTGGKQMDEFCNLIRWIVAENGMPGASIYTQSNLALPGYFRPTKSWDLLVVHEKQLIAAVEFKSQAGPSFGNNFNNRTEEAIGTATDLWTAFREGAFGKGHPRPWLGWLMLVEDCEGSTRPIKQLDEPHFPVLGEFRDASYEKRYELLLGKLMMEKLFDGVALLLSKRDSPQPAYREPLGLGLKGFLAGLAGHVQVCLAVK